MRGFVRRHPALCYFALTFAISWGGILAIVGPANILRAPEQFERLGWVAPLVLGPSTSGIVLTAIVGGRRGLRDYASRLVRGRVGARWIAIALLTAPIYTTLIALALSRFSPMFLPAFLTTDDAQLFVTGTIVALSAGIFEELGWTGFATPTLRRRYSALATGLIVGVMCGLWHVLPEMLGAPALDYVAYLPLHLTSVVLGLVGFRILMVWVFDRTRQSLLVGILMHASLTGALMMIQPLIAGAPLVGFGIAQGLAAWLIVVGVLVYRRGGTRRSGPPLAPRPPVGHSPATTIP